MLLAAQQDPTDDPAFGMILFILGLLWFIGGWRVLAQITGANDGKFPGLLFAFKWATILALIVAIAGAAAGFSDAGQAAAGIFVGALGVLNALHWILPVFFGGRKSRPEKRAAQEDDRASRERSKQQQLQDVERQRAQQQKEAETAAGRRRRLDVRFRCEAFYDRHRSVLIDKFPESRLADYLARYLSDEHSTQEVEERAAHLMKMLQDIIDESGNGRPRFQSVAEIREHYYHERLRVDDAEVDVDLKETLLSDLARDEELAIRDFQQR